jgi:2'-hydroxyisoflavone reductase
MRVLVIGGTAFIGRLLVESLVKAKHDVVVLHRKTTHGHNKKVGNIIADRNNPEQMRKALAGEKFDVVFDNVYDWERGTTEKHVEGTLMALERFSRYVFMSSVAAYGDGLNHHETDALAPDDHADPYVRNKARTERMLFRAYHRHNLPVVTLRPPFVYGPGNPYYREAFFWDRIKEGRPIILPGDGRRLMQFTFVKDLVASCMKVMDEPTAVGQAFNIANSRALTQEEVVQKLAEAAGRKVNVVSMPRRQILQAGGHPMGPQLYFGMYFDLPAITMLTNKAQRMLKIKPVDFSAGLRETYRWYLKNRSRKKIDYSFEDSLIEIAKAG